MLVSQSLLTATQKTLIRTLLIIMGAMILAIMVIVLFVSQWMTKPVEEMSSTITRIKDGETQLRVQPVGWSQELTTLGTEFNEMLDRICEAFRSEKSFVSVFCPKENLGIITVFDRIDYT